MKENYLSRPQEVEVFPVRNGTDVILRKNIQEVETEDGTIWECEEKQIRSNKAVTREEAEAEFDSYWHPTPEAEPTMEERMEAMEAALLELAEVMVNG